MTSQNSRPTCAEITTAKKDSKPKKERKSKEKDDTAAFQEIKKMQDVVNGRIFLPPTEGVRKKRQFSLSKIDSVFTDRKRG